VLKITPAQESAWKAYETSLQQQAKTMQALRGQMQTLMQNAQPGSAEFIAQRDAMIKQHDANFAGRAAAFKDLFAVLTPEQRVIADGSFGPMGGYHMGSWR
jgi:Spy/CpxP family protein refolding chaperone